MRKSLVSIVVAAGVVAAVAVPAAQANVIPQNVTVQFGAVGQGATPPLENSVTPDALQIRAGGTVTFNIDGFHQAAAYRLRFGESYEQAFARLDARADETDAAGVLRQRMAGQDPFVAPVAGTIDRLTFRDVLSGFVYVGPTKVPPPVVTTEISPRAPWGRYVLLCNVRGHYKGVFAGQPYSMRATLEVK